MKEAKQYIQQAWEVAIVHIKALDNVDEIYAAWSDFTSVLEAYTTEARDRRDLHRSHDIVQPDLRFSATEALVGLAAWKISDEREHYKEIGDTLRYQLNRSHDLLLNALSINIYTSHLSDYDSTTAST